MTDSTETKQKPAHLFKPGQSGNPAGRPKGSRNKLSEDFWADLCEAWKAKGKDALDKMIAEKPGDFVRVVASQMPTELNVTKSPLGDLSDDELATLLQAVRGLIATSAGEDAGERAEATTRH